MIRFILSTIICIILVYAGIAVGSQRRYTTGAVELQTKAGVQGGAFNSGDSLQFLGHDKKLKLNLPNTFISALYFETENIHAKVLENTKIGSVVNMGRQSKFLVVESIAAGKTLTLAGEHYQDLGPIDFMNQTGILEVNASTPITLSDNTQLKRSSNATFNILSDLTISRSFGGKFCIGSPSKAATLTIDASKKEFAFSGDNLHFANPNSTFRLYNNSETDKKLQFISSVASGLDNYGVVELYTPKSIIYISGSSFGTDSTHRLKELRVYGNAAFDNNVFAKKVITSGPVVKFKKVDLGSGGELAIGNYKIQGNITGHNTSITLSDQKVVYLGTAWFDGNVSVYTTITDKSNGCIESYSSGSIIDISKAEQLIINITDNANVKDESGNIRTLFGTANGGKFKLTDANKITVVQPLNKFVRWQYVGEGKIARSDTASQELSAALPPSDSEDVMTALIDSQNYGAEAAVIDDFAEIAKQDRSLFAKAVDKLSRPTRSAHREVVANITAGALHHGASLSAAAPSAFSGIAAGDGDSGREYSLWAAPFLNTSKKSSHKSSPAYDTKTFGGTIGLNVKMSEKLILSPAITSLRSGIMYKGTHKSDKTYINSTALALHTTKQLNNNWVVTAAPFIAKSTVSNYENRITAIGNAVAYSKYKSISYGGESFIGYKYQTSSIAVTPMLGIHYARYEDKSYSEKGSGAQNFYVPSNKRNALEGIIGGKVASRVMTGDAVVIPEGHVFVRRNLINKANKTKATLVGMLQPITLHQEKLPMYSYNLGAKANVEYGKMRYGIGCSVDLAGKYVGYQYMLNIKVNF